MRIRITEGQANRLNILNNGDNPVKLLNQYTKLKMDVIDSIYEMISNLSISELISSDLNIDKYMDIFDGIEIGINKYKENAFNFIGHDDEKEEERREADIISYDLERKISGLSGLVNILSRVKNELGENEYLRMFNGNEPLDVTK